MEQDLRRGGFWLLVSIAIHGVWLAYYTPAAAPPGPVYVPVAAVLGGFGSLAVIETPTREQALPEAAPPAVQIEQAPVPVRSAAPATRPAAPTTSEPTQPVVAKVPPAPASPVVSFPPGPSAVAQAPPEPRRQAEPREPVVTRSPRYAEPPAMPVYPQLARRRGWQGEVLLAIDVTASGIAAEPVVLRSSGFDLLDRAALEVARQWRFVPEQRNGLPMPTRVEVPVQFALR